MEHLEYGINTQSIHLSQCPARWHFEFPWHEQHSLSILWQCSPGLGYLFDRYVSFHFETLNYGC